MAAARADAIHYGGASLDMTVEGEKVAAAVKGVPWSLERPLWVMASRRLVSAVGGEIHVYLGMNVTETSVFITEEWPLVKTLVGADNVVFHFVH